ncbi:MAG: Rne/Rng family ribonuclease [Mariprofundales bacterium]
MHHRFIVSTLLRSGYCDQTATYFMLRPNRWQQRVTTSALIEACNSNESVPKNMRRRHKRYAMTTVTKRMLINASHDEERRVAITLNDYMQELDIESAQKVITKSNIYRGTITKIEASLQACFVEYGSGRQGFLPINEIHPDYWKGGVDKEQNPRKVNIQDVLEGKQQILVQVVKEERGNKGAALTTFISLAGRYLVLSPNTMRGGISRKLSDEDRRALKAIVSQLNVPEDVGLIVRTAGRDQNLEALQRDFSYLTRLWDEIRIKGNSAPAPALIYMEGDLATRAIRDHFTDDIAEIWVDNHEVYTRTKEFVHAVIPGKEKLVKLYRGKKPLFRQYNIESQCEEIHEREIRLPSGGSLVFDPTEALTSIDINSSRSTKSKHIDDTALATNLEAADEIARQLRIRDIGGLIVIDFIDMASRKHGQQVEDALRLACDMDKARIQITRISRFGLMEMSRQRLHPSVRETTSQVCPRCQGRGSVLTTESMALHILTRIEDWAEDGKKPELAVQVPSETGEYLMNNKRDWVARIEENYELQVSLQIRPDLNVPHYRIERLWTDNNQKRNEVLEDTSKVAKAPRPGKKLRPLKPVVGIPKPPAEPKKAASPNKPASTPKTEGKPGLIKRLVSVLFGDKSSDNASEKENVASEERPRTNTRNRGGRNTTSRGSRGGRSRRQDGEETNKRQTQAVTAPANSAEGKTDTDGEEARPKKRRRRRRKPANPEASTSSDSAQMTTEIENSKKSPAKSPNTSEEPEKANHADLPNEANGIEGEEKKPRKRRRRRRKPATASGEATSSESNSGDTNSGNESPPAETAPSTPPPADERAPQ